MLSVRVQADCSELLPLIWNWLLNCYSTITINGNIDQPEEGLNNKINAWLIAWKYECYLSHSVLPFQLRDNGVVRREHLRCSCWNFWCNFAYCFEAERCLLSCTRAWEWSQATATNVCKASSYICDLTVKKKKLSVFNSTQTSIFNHFPPTSLPEGLPWAASLVCSHPWGEEWQLCKSFLLLEVLPWCNLIHSADAVLNRTCSCLHWPQARKFWKEVGKITLRISRVECQGFFKEK